MKSCTANISTSDKQWRPTFTSQSPKTLLLNETSETKNCEEVSETGAGISLEVDANINSKIIACVGTEHPQKGKFQSILSSVSPF